MSSLMSIGMRGMTAATASLDVTGHNIANANVKGYSRQQANLETAAGQFTGSGFFGKGVNVTNVTRAHDDFLTMQATAAAALQAKDDSHSSQLQQLEKLFPAGEQGIGFALGDFLNAAVDLSNNPADSSARQVLLARASDVAARFRTASDRIGILQQGVTADLQAQAATLNGYAAQVAKINQQIAANHGVDQLPNDLMDQRDQLIKQMSGIMGVSTLQASDGTVSVFVGSGQSLVLGNEASQIIVNPDPADSSRSALSINTAGESMALNADQLGGGSMAGLMTFQNDDLVDARNQIGQMAMAFASKVNGVQSLGLDLRDPPQVGSALFNIGAPVAQANSNNARDAAGAYLAKVNLTVSDASQLQASDYDLRPDGSGVAGRYKLTRLSDGLVRTVNDGATVDGFKISVGTPDLQPGDSFRLQPVGAAAAGMTRALDDASGIAAALPVTATMGTANTGTASVNLLKVTDPAINPSLTANVSFTDGSGHYSWSLTDSAGTVTSSGTGTWTAGQPISLNGFELTLNGVPASGDTLSVAKTTFPASNNGNALALASLRDEAFVGRYTMSDGSIGGGATVTDAYAATMADVGVRVQSAKSAAAISKASQSDAETALAS
ncbi:flagellar hook-associated protein FlgK, partial [Ideonella sp. B508-1]|uniref:flagellar hook-associated protein FlgK n=1 Tax=Ideonella sp. B508-1 TaxID=137716 RepID=UPI000590F95F